MFMLRPDFGLNVKNIPSEPLGIAGVCEIFDVFCEIFPAVRWESLGFSLGIAGVSLGLQFWFPFWKCVFHRKFMKTFRCI